MTPATESMCRFVGLMSAAVALRDEPAIRRAFDRIPDERCDDAYRSVMAFLSPVDQVWAAHVMPTLGHRKAAREFVDRTTPRHKPSPEPTARRDLSRMAFRLLRSGAPARHYVAELRAANRLRSDPLSDRDLDSLAVWCAERHREESDA